jgi:hypothetical protein
MRVKSGAGGVALANDGDNRIVTATGSEGVNGEANLSFDGSTLAVTGALTTTTTAAIGTDLTVSGNILIDDGGSISDAGGTAALTLNAAGEITVLNIAAGTIAQASDHIIFMDGGATGEPKVESVDDFLTAIAGSGISVSSSQLTASGGSSNNDLDSLLHHQVFS